MLSEVSLRSKDAGSHLAAYRQPKDFSSPRRTPEQFSLLPPSSLDLSQKAKKPYHLPLDR